MPTGSRSIRAARGGRREPGPWRRWIDTALDSPNDIVAWQKRAAGSGPTYRAEARSVVVLFARAGDGASLSVQSVLISCG